MFNIINCDKDYCLDNQIQAALRIIIKYIRISLHRHINQLLIKEIIINKKKKKKDRKKLQNREKNNVIHLGKCTAKSHYKYCLIHPFNLS
ncbi:hypothetical protein PUN28_019246 [Cardiocondyla obscurior]|uniref:Uncharacterized protein n=1 Tax=Cardiocondyla obscurior TaxID=286306 RepID=A0AAW2ECN8_9HYME